MTVIDLNEIYKIIYYKYILSIKGVKHSRSFKTMSLGFNQGFRVFFIISKLFKRNVILD